MTDRPASYTALAIGLISVVRLTKPSYGRSDSGLTTSAETWAITLRGHASAPPSTTSAPSGQPG